MDPYQPPQELPVDNLFSIEIEAAARQRVPASALALKIFWHNFGLLFAVFFVIWGPLHLGTSYIEQHYIDEDDVRSSLRMQQQASLWFGIIATGAAVSVIAASYDGQRRRFGAAMVDGLRLWPKLWTTYFLYIIAMSIGLVLLIIPGIYIAVRGFYCMTIAAAEEVHGPTAINRSFALTQRRFGETFVRGLVVIGIYFVVSVAMMMVMIPIAFFAFDVGLEDIFAMARTDSQYAITYYEYDSYAEYEPSFLETWYWAIEGAVASFTLVANMFVAVYVYCWYRHVDHSETSILAPKSGTPNLLPIEPMTPQTPNEQFRW
ncbi:MAG: hypothetical protein WBD20_19870 [Pirellulaceae bacterium]